jgi:hypothetical protein
MIYYSINVCLKKTKIKIHGVRTLIKSAGHTYVYNRNFDGTLTIDRLQNT